MNEIINQISDLEKQISDNLNHSKSKNTLKAYRSDFEDFENFCKKYSFQSRIKVYFISPSVNFRFYW